MSLFSRKQKVQLDALCRDFYDRNILNPIIAGVDAGRTYADTVMRSVAEADVRFAAVDLDRFNSEMMLIRFEIFALAWMHQLGDKHAAAQSVYTKTYLKERDRENVWEGLAHYNQAVARSSTMGQTADTPTGRAYLAFTNKMRVDLFDEWQKQGFEPDAAARAANRIGTRDLGVSGDAKAEEIWRPKGEAYPMPPMKTFRSGDIWLKGFEANGIRMVPAAVGMNSTEYRGRRACIYDGWCHVGCPIGALANPQVTYLGDARKAGTEVRPLSTVTRVLMSSDGQKAIGVEYYDSKKEKQVQEASVVVLAAWASHNPRLLLNSTTDKHPRGLANASGLVGKYMMAHYASGTWAIFDEDLQNHMGTIGAQYHSYDRYDKTSHKGFIGSTYVNAGTALKTSDLAGFANARLDLFGPDLAAFMKRAARGLSRISAFGEEMPNIENRIELIDEKDEFGMPMAKIVHSFDQDAVGIWNANFDEGLMIAKAAGAQESWSARGNQPTIHLFGGTIMGTQASDSVTNSYGQTHEIGNLWIAGPGLFPTEGASNPTYTIFAVSLRGAEHLAQSWGSVAG